MAGGANADPSGSGSCAARPSGTENSEVGWSSSIASGTIPAGVVKALRASSDFGFRSSVPPEPSASVTRPPVLVSPGISMRNVSVSGETKRQRAAPPA
ncbi:hypothetical protein GCM10010336_32020 [Streptomyces goshikiensis]|nr:hypothetical protein GCM10010336_32020 [Streptomyces goshikiensis]